jgi:NADPH:quinone reductase-like Zn-dependent oxidoreductase
MREGIHPETPPLPFTPGWDLVGVVDQLGNGVCGIEPGQMVAALPISGAYAEYVCLPQTELVPVPAGLEPAQAVSLVLNYVTAYQMLHRSAKVRPGQRVLIHGAAGGVGSALLQLGRLAGLELYGTCSSRGASAVSQLGGIPIDYEHQDFVKEMHGLTEEGVDAVFDSIGGSHIWRSRKAVRPGGTVVAYGLTGSLRGGRFRASGRSSSFSCDRDLRLVHRWWLGSPGSQTSRALQHPVAQTHEAVIVSTGLDHAVRPAQTTQDQAADRGATSPCRGKTRPRVARDGRCDRQDRPRADGHRLNQECGITPAPGSLARPPRSRWRRPETPGSQARSPRSTGSAGLRFRLRRRPRFARAACLPPPGRPA